MNQESGDLDVDGLPLSSEDGALLMPFGSDVPHRITLNRVEMFETSCRIDATLALGLLANPMGK